MCTPIKQRFMQNKRKWWTVWPDNNTCLEAVAVSGEKDGRAVVDRIPSVWSWKNPHGGSRNLVSKGGNLNHSRYWEYKVEGDNGCKICELHSRNNKGLACWYRWAVSNEQRSIRNINLYCLRDGYVVGLSEVCCLSNPVLPSHLTVCWSKNPQK